MTEPLCYIPSPYGKPVAVFKIEGIPDDGFAHDFNGCMDIAGIHDPAQRDRCFKALSGNWKERGGVPFQLPLTTINWLASPVWRRRNGSVIARSSAASSARAGVTVALIANLPRLKSGTIGALKLAERAMPLAGAVAMRSQWDRNYNHNHNHIRKILAKGEKP